TRAGTHDQRRGILGNDARRVLERLLGNGDVPSIFPRTYPQRTREAEQPVHHVLARRGLDAVRGEEPLQIERALAVVAEFDRGSHERRGKTRAERELHVQQQIETAPPERTAQGRKAGEPRSLVVHDELDLRYAADERRLGAADQPREARL